MGEVETLELILSRADEATANKLTLVGIAPFLIRNLDLKEIRALLSAHKRAVLNAYHPDVQSKNLTNLQLRDAYFKKVNQAITDLLADDWLLEESVRQYQSNDLIDTLGDKAHSAEQRLKSIQEEKKTLLGNHEQTLNTLRTDYENRLEAKASALRSIERRHAQDLRGLQKANRVLRNTMETMTTIYSQFAPYHEHFLMHDKTGIALTKEAPLTFIEFPLLGGGTDHLLTLEDPTIPDPVAREHDARAGATYLVTQADAKIRVKLQTGTLRQGRLEGTLHNYTFLRGDTEHPYSMKVVGSLTYHALRRLAELRHAKGHTPRMGDILGLQRELAEQQQECLRELSPLLTPKIYPQTLLMVHDDAGTYSAAREEVLQETYEQSKATALASTKITPTQREALLKASPRVRKEPTHKHYAIFPLESFV